MMLKRTVGWIVRNVRRGSYEFQLQTIFSYREVRARRPVSPSRFFVSASEIVGAVASLRFASRRIRESPASSRRSRTFSKSCKLSTTNCSPPFFVQISGLIFSIARVSRERSIIRLRPMNHAPDDNHRSSNIEQDTPVANPQPPTRSETGQSFHITGEIIPHRLDLREDAPSHRRGHPPQVTYGGWFEFNSVLHREVESDHGMVCNLSYPVFKTSETRRSMRHIHYN